MEIFTIDTEYRIFFFGSAAICAVSNFQMSFTDGPEEARS